MGYSAFEPRVLPIIVVYLILIIAGSIVTYKILRKYIERKQPAALHLAIVYTFFTLAILVLAIGLTEAIITGYYMEIYRFSLPLAYSLVAIANIFLYFFASRITNKWKSVFIPIILIGAILIIVLFLPWNWWGYPREDYAGKFNIRLYTNIAFITFAYVIYGMIAYIAYKSKAKADEKVAQLGLTLLFYSMISMMLFFLMVLLDNLMIVLYNHPGYSEFQFASWIFALIFVILTYFSLVMPEWLVKRVKKE
ncbi:MAG: hypothetical protein EU532_02615 [Promethearchaeota archaeon]|nr:MAG: hypothetical protein EU532_02615 [Candidatus Lokiarchaeota archaeon]